MVIKIHNKDVPCMLTEHGLTTVTGYIKELRAKRKEILDAGKDTAEDTTIPTLNDIISDIEWFFDEDLMEYCNNWGVTDNYNADWPLRLEFREDITPENYKCACHTESRPK